MAEKTILHVSWWKYHDKKGYITLVFSILLLFLGTLLINIKIIL